MPLTIAPETDRALESTKPAAEVTKKGMDVAITKVKASADVRVAQLELVQSVFDTIGKGIEYFRTREEWRAKVVIARQGVEKALVELDKARGDQKNRAEELRQLGAVREKLGAMIDQYMADLADAGLSDAAKQALRRDAIHLATQLASIDK